MKTLTIIPPCLFTLFTLFGCSPAVVEEIAEGVTEGVIDEIEEYRSDKDSYKD